MRPLEREAQAIRLQLVELSEHILRRLGGTVKRARAHSPEAYGEIEGAVQQVTRVQHEVMEELSRPVARHEELDLLTSLMRIQDRSLAVLDQLERMPFNHEPSDRPGLGRLAGSPRSRGYVDPPPLIAPWPEEALAGPAGIRPPTRTPNGDAPWHQPARQPPHAGVQQVPSPGPGPRPVPLRPVDPPGGPPPSRRAAPPPDAKRPPRPAVTSSVDEVVIEGEIEEQPKTAAKPGRGRQLVPVDPAAPKPKRRTLKALGENLVAFARALPQTTLAVVFIGLGLVAVVIFARMFFVVADGLVATKRGPGEPTKISSERLPAEDKALAAAISSDGRAGRQMLPPTGEAYVVVLSMHDTVPAARKTFAELQQKMPGPLSGMAPDIQPIETANGLRYRLALAPALSRERAFAMCSEFKSAGFPACWLRRLQR